MQALPFVGAIIRRRPKRNGEVVEDLLIDYQPRPEQGARRIPRLQTKYPGGGVEPGETLYAALKREVHKETGLWIPPERHIVPIYLSPPSLDGHVQWFYLIEAWRCRGRLWPHLVEEGHSTLSNQRFVPLGCVHSLLYKTHKVAFVASLGSSSRIKQCA